MGRYGWHEQQETQQEQEQQEQEEEEEEEEEQDANAIFLRRFLSFNQLVQKFTEKINQLDKNKLTNWIKTN